VGGAARRGGRDGPRLHPRPRPLLQNPRRPPPHAQHAKSGGSSRRRVLQAVVPTPAPNRVQQALVPRRGPGVVRGDRPAHPPPQQNGWPAGQGRQRLVRGVRGPIPCACARLSHTPSSSTTRLIPPFLSPTLFHSIGRPASTGECNEPSCPLVAEHRPSCRPPLLTQAPNTPSSPKTHRSGAFIINFPTLLARCANLPNPPSGEPCILLLDSLRDGETGKPMVG
jgi:hypothetical protein